MRWIELRWCRYCVNKIRWILLKWIKMRWDNIIITGLFNWIHWSCEIDRWVCVLLEREVCGFKRGEDDMICGSFKRDVFFFHLIKRNRYNKKTDEQLFKQCFNGAPSNRKAYFAKRKSWVFKYSIIKCKLINFYVF